jgi:hypothetical protein
MPVSRLVETAQDHLCQAEARAEIRFLAQASLNRVDPVSGTPPQAVILTAAGKAVNEDLIPGSRQGPGNAARTDVAAGPGRKDPKPAEQQDFHRGRLRR